MARRTDTASRVVDASPDRVYAALVVPDTLVAWLPPEGMSASFERFDARPGGGFRLVLTYDDPSGSPGKSTPDSDVVEARFVELVPGSRVVQDVDFVADDPRHAGTMTMTWELTPTESGTRVEIRADNVPPDTYRVYIAPLIFGLAPVINVLVSSLWHPEPGNALHFKLDPPGWKMWVGILLVGAGAALVLFSKEEAEVSKKQAGHAKPAATARMETPGAHGQP